MRKLFFVFALIILCFGCSSPRAWTYKSEPFVKETPVINKTVAVPPFSDQRLNENSNAILMYLIPLMPFGWQDFNTPEGANLHCMSGQWIFRPNEDFAKAVAEELHNSSIFKEVFFTYKPGDGDFILRGKIESTKYNCKLITYGLSVEGPLLWFIGLPSAYVENQLQLNLKLVDQKSDEVIWEKNYLKADDKVSILYALKSDFLYDSLLKSIMKEALPDLKAKLKEYQKKQIAGMEKSHSIPASEK